MGSSTQVVSEDVSEGRRSDWNSWGVSSSSGSEMWKGLAVVAVDEEGPATRDGPATASERSKGGTAVLVLVDGEGSSRK